MPVRVSRDGAPIAMSAMKNAQRAGINEQAGFTALRIYGRDLRRSYKFTCADTASPVTGEQV